MFRLLRATIEEVSTSAKKQTKPKQTDKKPKIKLDKKENQNRKITLLSIFFVVLFFNLHKVYFPMAWSFSH